ncbi:MAG: hypothetical protein ABI432_11305 [Flavobacteriales bacterium]
MRAGRWHIVVCCMVLFGARSLADAPQDWTTVPGSAFVEAKQGNDSRYKDLPRFSMDIELVSYRSWDDQAPHERTQARVVRDASRFRSEVSGLVSVQDPLIRVVMDPQEHVIMATDPVDLNDAWAIGAVDIVLSSVATCFERSVDGGKEYKLVFKTGAVYDHTIVRYDAQGWLRHTSTVWRQTVQEDPSDRLSAAYRPRLDVSYGIPRTLTGPADASTDPWSLVREGKEGLEAIGAWKDIPIIDTRYRP